MNKPERWPGLTATVFAGLLLATPAPAQDIDILNPPPEMLQLAWRLPDGRVHLQYTYTAPNSCWSAGDTHLTAPPQSRQAEFLAVPRFSAGFCATVMTPIGYSRDLDIGPVFEALRVVVEHPEGGVIEESLLLILDAEEAPR